MDPNEKVTTGTEGADGAAAAAEAPAVPQSDAEKASMMREAMAAADQPEPAPAAAQAADEAGADDGAEEEAGEEAGADDAAADAGAGGEEAGPDAQARAEADAAHTKAVDEEVKSLGLKGKTEERFRELANGAKEGVELKKVLEPLEAIATEQGIPVAKLVPYMMQRAERAQEWEDKVMSTGANPEQFGRAMAALAAVNSEDPVVLGNLRTVLMEELAFVDERLGFKTTKFNPLDQPGNEDIKQDVEIGELSEARGLELATARLQQRKIAESRTQAGEKAVQQTTVVDEAVKAVAQLGADLKELDPDGFAAKMQLIAPQVRKIQAELPPTQWAAAVKQAYVKAKVAKPASRVTRIPPAARGTVSSDAVEQKATNPLDALRQAVRGVEAKAAR